MKPLTFIITSIFFIYAPIGSVSERLSPTLITDATMPSTEKTRTQFKQHFGANNLLKEITKSGDFMINCHREPCLPNTKANRQAEDLGFTSTFYFREALPARNEIDILAE